MMLFWGLKCIESMMYFCTKYPVFIGLLFFYSYFMHYISIYIILNFNLHDIARSHPCTRFLTQPKCGSNALEFWLLSFRNNFVCISSHICAQNTPEFYVRVNHKQDFSDFAAVITGNHWLHFLCQAGLVVKAVMSEPSDCSAISGFTPCWDKKRWANTVNSKDQPSQDFSCSHSSSSENQTIDCQRSQSWCAWLLFSNKSIFRRTMCASYNHTKERSDK